MKVLVTGGAGFIGSHTVDLLVSKGFDVRIFDNFEKQVHGEKKPDYLNRNVEMVSGDVTNVDQWENVLTGVDAVIHLAAMVGMGQSMYQPVKYLSVNTIGTANMYEAILRNPDIRKNIQKIIVASSKSIYGEGAYMCEEHGIVYPNSRKVDQLEKNDWEVYCTKCSRHANPVGISEDKPVQNLAIYSLSKYDTERISMDFAAALGITTVAFRYFNVYGPRQSLNNPYTGVAAIFLSRLKNNNQPVIYEDGNQIRDFIHVQDIAAANVLALEKAKESDVYNVGTGQQITIAQIARLLSKILGAGIEPDITNKFRAGDNRHDFSDIDKIKKVLGFSPKWKLEEGLKDLVQWSESQTAIDKFDEAEKERLKYFSR